MVRIPPEKEYYPVEGVNRDTARAYCRWVEKRLPFESEWEVAARGPFHWNYPWGNLLSAVTLPTDAAYPVGNVPLDRSFFDVYDMASNGMEWVDRLFTNVRFGERVLRGNIGDSLEMLNHVLAVKANDQTAKQDAGFCCAADAKNVKVEPDPSLFFDHDFMDTNTGWPEMNTTLYIYNYYHNGWYHIEVRAPWMSIPAMHPTSVTGDFVLETESHVDPTTPDNMEGVFQYGLAVEINQEDFLAFVISAHTKEWQILRSVKRAKIRLP